MQMQSILLLLGLSFIQAAEKQQESRVELVVITKEQIQEVARAFDQQFLGRGVYNVPQAKSISSPISIQRPSSQITCTEFSSDPLSLPDPLGMHLSQTYQRAEISKTPESGYVRLTF